VIRAHNNNSHFCYSVRPEITSTKKEKRMKRYAAEFIGTFWLVLGGSGSAVVTAAFPGVGIGLLGISNDLK
jgi:hypothetical protein